MWRLWCASPDCTKTVCSAIHEEATWPCYISVKYAPYPMPMVLQSFWVPDVLAKHVRCDLPYQGMQASVLVWASDFLEGSTEDAKERLEELQQSTTSCGLPSVSVESKKLLAELVGVRPRFQTALLCMPSMPPL